MLNIISLKCIFTLPITPLGDARFLNFPCVLPIEAEAKDINKTRLRGIRGGGGVSAILVLVIFTILFHNCALASSVLLKTHAACLHLRCFKPLTIFFLFFVNLARAYPKVTNLKSPVNFS